MSTPPVPDGQEAADINTYHCSQCSHLLLATTHLLSSLPTRHSPALDHAMILPLPPAHSDDPGDSSSSESEGEGQQEDSRRTGKPSRKHDTDVGYSILLSTTVDRKPVMIRREDGFEKRALLRCGRCKVIVGYKLDETHFGSMDEAQAGKDGRVVYLLQGGLVGTNDMVEGKKAEEPELS